MAFRRPIHRPVRRAATPPPIATTLQQPKKPDAVQESQEWVLFSPLPDEGVHDNNNTTTTPFNPRTIPRSRQSDFGSLDTAAVSERHRHRQPADDEDHLAEEQDDEDDEADSLDEGLHAFNEPTSISNPSAHHCLSSSLAEPVLPAHDGLGGFNGNSAPIQQQLWHYERFNPRRATGASTTLRTSEVQRRLDALNEEEKIAAPRDPVEERNRRIEKWRLDQSRAIVEEIERETRRRRRKSKLNQSSIIQQRPDDSASSQKNDRETVQTHTAPATQPQDARQTEPHSFWTRTTQVIRELIGIDDATLAYIFGGTVSPVGDAKKSASIAQHLTSSETIAHAEHTVPDGIDLFRSSNGWEDNLLARIARELGTFVYQLTDHSPSAFNTYMKVQETVPYAGFPTPPELSTPAGFLQFNLPPPPARPTHQLKHRRRASMARTDPSLFGIEEEPATDAGAEPEKANGPTPQQMREQPSAPNDEAKLLQHEKAYWEQDLDMKMVLGYLKSRLRRRSSQLAPRSTPDSHTAQSTAPTFSSATASGPDALRRAALIRHHHPLVSRNLNSLRATSQSALDSQAMQLPTTPLSPILGRRNSSVIDDGVSSCASQSTKKSKTHHSGSFSITSSRNYWDIGGPSWGEV